MAEIKQSMGNDPLAWLADENQEKTPTGGGLEKKNKPSQRAKKSVQEKSMKSDIEIIEESFAHLAANGEQIVSAFYETLLGRHPELSPFFDSVSMAGQRKKLLAALVLLVNNLRKPDVLKQYLWDLGARHQEYGIAAEDYGKVASSLLDVLKKHAGEVWTSEVEQAWSNTLQTVAKEMLSAYKAVGDEKMTVNITEEKITAANAELVRMRSAVDGAMTAIMMVDRDFNITYANQATLDMLSEHEGVLKEIFPGFSVKGLVGSNIDTFHKNPKHQRQLLNDPNNLPYSTDIKVGPLQFRLNVTAMIDDEGNYIGNTLEWANVTETRAKEREVARLSGAVQGAMTSIMMIDRDFIITYVNDATVSMLKPHQDTLRTIFPGFDAENLVGQNIDIFHKNPEHQRQMLSNPNNLPYSTEIKVGPLQFQLNVTATYAPDGEYIGNALEWSNITETKAKALEVSRLQSAIAGSETALMMCDENRVITYCNPAVLDLLRRRSGDLKKIWPGLDVDNLVGKTIDSFHKQPSHQASILSDPSKLPYKTQIQVLDLHFGLNATAIVDDQGNMIGNMVEWTDITEQKRGETEIASLIQAAQRGELRERLKADEYDGFMKTVAGGVNNLMDVVLAPTEEIISVSRAMSEGDLTKFIEGDYQGMFEELATALNNSIQKMSTTVTDITEAAVSIASAATEISQGNIDLSQRTEEQASSLEETASSMEELTSTVRQNSDNARQANQLAVDAREKAEKGGSVIQNAIHAMAAISASSKKVADIIGVIDEIAFQTNLLALNAAVEAARAGEQGRGFAVVASEVRNLAQRSAAAAKEIKELINDSGDKVKEGSALVDESGKTLEEIVEGAKKVGDIISEIAAAGLEQTSGIEQVNKAVTQMDEMTQQNAALVEEAAAASESLDEQGKSLQQLMAFFNTGIDASSHVVETKQVARHSSTRPAQKTANPQVNKPKSRPAQTNENDDEWEEF